MSTPRSGRRRAPASMASACAVQAERERLARMFFHPTQGELEALGYHWASACGMPLHDRVAYFLAAVARAYGLSDPEARA